jgi:hypothetical protein
MASMGKVTWLSMRHVLLLLKNKSLGTHTASTLAIDCRRWLISRRVSCHIVVAMYTYDRRTLFRLPVAPLFGIYTPIRRYRYTFAM